MTGPSLSTVPRLIRARRRDSFSRVPAFQETRAAVHLMRGLLFSATARIFIERSQLAASELPPAEPDLLLVNSAFWFAAAPSRPIWLSSKTIPLPASVQPLQGDESAGNDCEPLGSLAELRSSFDPTALCRSAVHAPSPTLARWRATGPYAAILVGGPIPAAA